MRLQITRGKLSGFTLIELLVVIALVAIVLVIAVPSFGNLIINQRMKSLNAQLVTDLQFARAEAAARNKAVFFSLGQSYGVMTCYVIYVPDTTDTLCSCTSSTCPGVTKLKSVEIPFNSKVMYQVPDELDESGIFAFDSVSGGLVYGTSDFVDASPTTHRLDTVVLGDVAGRNLRTTISPAGRPTVCSFGSKRISGFTQC